MDYIDINKRLWDQKTEIHYNSDFKEYNYSPYDCFENTVKIDDRKFQIKGLENKIPMIYSLKAVKG